MNEQKRGTAEFGLNLEVMVARAWRIFLTRPLTLLGVSCLVLALWLPAHLFAIPSIFWLPFSLCVPFATVHILREERSDRIFLGWIDFYPRVLAIFAPAAMVFIVLYILCGFFMVFLGEVFESEKRFIYWGPFLLAMMIESIVGHTLALAALVAVRKKVSATDALLELFSTRRQVLEAFLLCAPLAMFGMSGILLCCVGVFATTTFAWICLGVAYYQMFEQ